MPEELTVLKEGAQISTKVTQTDEDVYDKHENHSSSFLNPLRNSNFDSQNFMLESGIVNFVSIVLGVVVILIVAYAMYLTFNFAAFGFSILATVSIFILKPDVLDALKRTPILQYYSLLITFSLVMALDDFKHNNNYLFLIIINMIISVISFLTQIKWFIVMGIYLNMYVLSLIAIVYRNNGFAQVD